MEQRSYIRTGGNQKPQGAPVTNLIELSGEAKEAATRQAMERGEELIYRGRISSGDLLG